MRTASSCLTLILLLVGIPSGPDLAEVAGQSMDDAAARARGREATSVLLDGDALSGLKWRSIGPATMGGRIADIEVAKVPGAPDVIYLGTAIGGLFKSTNQGTTWDPVFDSVEGMIGIGHVAVAPSNPNLVWVGTGEANNRQSSSWGEGVYKSVDGGRSWSHMGLKETRHVGRIVIHPTNPDVVYVAGVGHLWGSNPERGVFKSNDGGETWERVLYVDEHTGAIDLAMDPHDPETVFAAMYQRRRRAWGFSGSGPGSGLYRTYDGGESWTELTGGLPEGDKGRIGLDIYRRDGRIIYAMVEADPRRGSAVSGPSQSVAPKGGIFRSTDRGDSWEHVNTLNPRPSYYSQIRIAPDNANRVYVMGTRLHVSDDGGKTFRDDAPVAVGFHPDHHDLWIDPDDSNHMILGGDGGVSISWDRGESWLFKDNLAIGQFYEIGVDMRDPYRVCGGLQDYGSWCLPSATRSEDGLSNHDVYKVGPGDGFYTLIDPNDHTIVFTESQGGRLNRFHLTTGERQAINPAPAEKPVKNEEGEEEGAHRWHWNSPVVMSSHDPATIYFGAQVVFRSSDRGRHWEVISADLTMGVDRDTLEMMGRRVTEETLSRHDGIASYPALTTIGESPLNADVLYTGSDDGQVHVTRDGGADWTNVTDRIPDLPPTTYVSRVVASHHAQGRVYATFDGHHNDDYRPYVYVSEDYGQRWRALARGLPEETSVNIIQEHPRNPRLLFVGHEKGVHLSIDGGATWASLNGNMPSVPVDDLIIHPRDNDLIVGTHGRGIWILDDIGPLEALTSEVLAAREHLLPVPTARLLHTYDPEVWFGNGQFLAPNPEFGAGITYYLGESSHGDVEVVISDAGGKVIRTLEGPGERGLNRVFWDLRMEPAYEPGAFLYALDPGPRGPNVLPGSYRVAVNVPRGAAVNGEESAAGLAQLTGQITVEADPLIHVSDADRQARQAAQLDLHELLKTMDAAQKVVSPLSDQIEGLKKQLAEEAGRGGEAASEEIQSRVEELAEKLSDLREDVRQVMSAVTGWQGLKGYLERWPSGPPRPDQLRQIDWLFEDATETVQELNGLLETELPSLYSELMDRNLWPGRVPHIVPPAPRRR